MCDQSAQTWDSYSITTGSSLSEDSLWCPGKDMISHYDWREQKLFCAVCRPQNSLCMCVVLTLHSSVLWILRGAPLSSSDLQSHLNLEGSQVSPDLPSLCFRYMTASWGHSRFTLSVFNLSGVTVFPSRMSDLGKRVVINILTLCWVIPLDVSGKPLNLVSVIPSLPDVTSKIHI